MGDGYPHGMAKQRHHGEPVRQGAHHGCLGKGGEPLPDAMIVAGPGNHEQDGRSNHQSRGYSLVSDQYPFSILHVLSPNLSLSESVTGIVRPAGHLERRLLLSRLDGVPAALNSGSYPTLKLVVTLLRRLRKWAFSLSKVQMGVLHGSKPNR